MTEEFSISIEKDALVSLINNYLKAIFPNRHIPEQICWINSDSKLSGSYKLTRTVNEAFKVEESCNITLEYRDVKLAAHSFLKLFCIDRECPSPECVLVQIKNGFSGAIISWRTNTSPNLMTWPSAPMISR